MYRSLVLPYLQVTCFVQPPVIGDVAVDAAAASAIAVYVEKLQPDVPDSFAPARLLSGSLQFRNIVDGDARTPRAVFQQVMDK